MHTAGSYGVSHSIQHSRLIFTRPAFPEFIDELYPKSLLHLFVNDLPDEEIGHYIAYRYPVTYDSIRLEMRRPLAPTEQLRYRGITSLAMTGLRSDELYGVQWAEELITAEFWGRRAVPSDCPSSVYLFSAGSGKTARFNDEYYRASRERQAKKKRKKMELER